MGIGKSVVLLLLVSIATNAWSHHHHGYYPDGRRKEDDHVDLDEGRSSFEKITDSVRSELLEKKNDKYPEAIDSKTSVPFNARRLEKMLEKAILKIITGDLSTADMLLLKSLNYSLEEVLMIRERELGRRKDEESRKPVEPRSNGRKSNDDEERKKDKYRNRNSMEFDSSSYRNDPEESRSERRRDHRYKEKSAHDKDFDFDAYNRQATIDYETLASKLEQQSWSEPDYEDEPKSSRERDSSQSFRRSFDRAMEPHVVFKIRYDDSEFDSSSGSMEEKSQSTGGHGVITKEPKHHTPPALRRTTAKNIGNSFHASSLSSSSSSSPAAAAAAAASSATGHTPLPVVYRSGASKSARPDYPSENRPSTAASSESNNVIVTNVTSNAISGVPADFNNSTNDGNSSGKNADANAGKGKISEYEGLEWIEDDVYRVIPSYTDLLNYEDIERNEMSDYEDQRPGFTPEGNDTLEYQNDTPDPVKFHTANANGSVANASLANLSAYQQMALAHRREGNVTSSFDSQGQKAIEDIKSRVLALTGRFNLSTNTNQVQRERLTMFSPTCQIPRNTDPEAWSDPFSMNMHFQLNLTSGDHVVAAKLRIYKLPQVNLTTSVSGTYDEDEDDEKKIRISVYYYTKSLKKHRSKKRLMDSVVTPLTADGTHLALDVRQGLRFWRLTTRNPHGNGSNHGLVIQIEDQDGRPLKPALYIQQPSCADDDSDHKASQRIPALFIRACTRYIRIVNGEEITYVNCRH